MANANLMFLPLLLGIMAASWRASEDPVRRLVLFDFETDGGSINLGGEFPGAQGEGSVAAREPLTISESGSHAMSLHFLTSRGHVRSPEFSDTRNTTSRSTA